MQRFVLVHEGQRILLPEGETVIGRGPTCNIRFKDPSVSREHVRVVVLDGRAAAANLSSNGTLLNGERLVEATRLGEGDELSLGFQRIRVEVIDEAPEPIEVGPVEEERRRPTDELAAQVDDADELTRPGEDGWRRRRREQVTLGPVLAATQLAEIQIHHCPQCQAAIRHDEEVCAHCRYRWPLDHGSTRTQDVDIARVPLRRDPRFPVELPVVYSSATLTLDAIVRDLSRGGLFIATELLDPVGTPCELTALPGGTHALHFSGLVAHVLVQPSVTRATGLGIQLIGGSPEALSWLEQTVVSCSQATVG